MSFEIVPGMNPEAVTEVVFETVPAIEMVPETFLKSSSGYVSRNGARNDSYH